MRTPTTINHHPLHPILVTFPIALWIFSFAADVIRLAGLGPEDTWSAVAFYSMAAGIAGALLAAVPGLVDLLWLHDPKLRQKGLIHGLLSVTVLLIFGADWGWRASGTAGMTGPFLLSIVGIVILGITGWLGGDLVHEHRVTVDEPAGGEIETPAHG